jgi:hypothetical protein
MKRCQDLRDGQQYVSPEYFLSKAKRFVDAARISLTEEVNYSDDSSDEENVSDQSLESYDGQFIEEVAIPSYTQTYYHPDKKRYLTTPYQPPKKTTQEWFPRTAPHSRTIQDPETGQYYAVEKEYDEDGVFQLRYIPLVRRKINYGNPRYIWEEAIE